LQQPLFPRHWRPRRPRNAPAPLDRRGFLKLAGVTAAAAALYPYARGASPAFAQPSPRVKALIEDLHLDAPALAAGALTGVVATPRGIRLPPGLNRGEYTSPVLTARTPFTHVGLHWLAESADGLSFEVRTSVDGRAWSDWDPVLIESHTRGDGSRDTFGALISADRATRLQFRAIFAAGARPTLLENTTATLINSKDGPTTLTLDAAASAPPLTSGAVLTRGDWGCDESLRFDAGGSEIWPRMYVPVKKVAVHHTATTNAYNSLEDAKAEVRAVYTYHAATLGWGDIGYHGLIDKFGNFFEGRHARGDGEMRETFGPDVVAGHALTHNYGSAGIALLGTHTKAGEGGRPGETLSTDSRATLLDILTWECDRHHIDPQAASNFLLSDDTWNTGLANLCGHRDCTPTICPGGNVYDELPSLRVDVAARLAPTRSLDASLSTSSGDTVPLGSVGDVAFGWNGDGSAIEILLEGWRRLAGSEDIVYLAGFDTARYPAWQTAIGTGATFGELFDLFGLGSLEAGHYTLHVLATGSGVLSYQEDHTLLVTDDGAGGNTTPVVDITSPADGSLFQEGDSIAFSGTATDAEDGDLTPGLVWTSDLDGQIGTGGSFSSVLSPGNHTITASVTDSGGLQGTESIAVTVEAPSGGGITLTATPYKLRGVQQVDLTWQGANTGVAIYRDNTLRATVDGTTYTDNIGARGGGSYTYRVESGALVSNEVTVTF
jgi:hypothetical protein